jgi:4'-phosphopantetheinyl transferase
MRDWPRTKPELIPNEAGAVRCWRIPIAAVAGPIGPQLQALLDPDERDRLERFRQLDDRRRFLAGHAGLRILLGAALGAHPQALRFTRGSHGKPALARRGDERTIEFNVAHSGRVALVALADDTPLGVDVEEIRPLPDRDAIATQFFHRSEAAALAALSDAEKDLAFFRTWTRKEAVTKALGRGLSLDLNAFCVSRLPGQDLEVRFDVARHPAAPRWTLVDLDPEPGHVGALAIAQRPVSLVYRTLDLADAVACSQA